MLVFLFSWRNNMCWQRKVVMKGVSLLSWHNRLWQGGLLTYHDNTKYSLKGLMLKLQYLSHMMWRSNLLEMTLMLGTIEGRGRRGWQRMSWLHSITDSMDMNLSKLLEIVKDRGAQRAAVHGVEKSRTQLSDLTNLMKAFTEMSSFHCLLLSLPALLKLQILAYSRLKSSASFSFLVQAFSLD